MNIPIGISFNWYKCFDRRKDAMKYIKEKTIQQNEMKIKMLFLFTTLM